MKAIAFLPIAAFLLIASTGCQEQIGGEQVAFDNCFRSGSTADNESPPKMAERWPEELARPWPAVEIPRLTQPFVADGELNEWGDALAAPVRAMSLSIYLQGDYEWRGPDDASMECFAAWTDEGLCVAVAIVDDEVFNDRPDGAIWDHDSVGIVVETGGEEELGGAKILFVPPTGGRPTRTYDPGNIGQDLTYKVKLHEGGYVVEMLIPWALLPDVTPEVGGTLGLRFTMIEYDQRAGEQVVPFGMTWHPSWRHTVSLRPPGLAAPAVLVETLARSPEANLESEVVLDVSMCPPAEDTEIPISIDLGLNLSLEVEGVQLQIDNWLGERVATEKLDLQASASSWGDRKNASYVWQLADVPPGNYTVTASILGADGTGLGKVYREVLVVRGFAEEVLARIEQADLAEMSVDKPFRAVDWLLVAANLERFKQEASWRSVASASRQARELNARLALLETGAVPPGDDDMFDLLTLTADDEAQVTVDFYQKDHAQVALRWGAMPLGAVEVRQYAYGGAVGEAFTFEVGEIIDMFLFTRTASLAKLTNPENGLTTVKMLLGRRIISMTSPSAELAEQAVAAVATGEPITLEQMAAFRIALAEQIEEVPEQPVSSTAKDTHLYVGDVHTHTIFSDGSFSPVYNVLQGLGSSMDFIVISDHNAIAGGQLAEAYAKRFGLAHNVIAGDEITTSFAHLNAYPLRELVDWEAPSYDIVRSAHAQGAVIQWNHPSESSANEWSVLGFSRGIGPLGVDAWEHIPPDYEQWRQEGKLPTLVGSTDMHVGYFTDLERSIILAPSAGGVDVAEAVRLGDVCLIDPTKPNIIYGPPHMIHLVREALLEGKDLRNRRKEYLRSVMSSLDITGLITASRTRKMTQDQADEVVRSLEQGSNE